MSRVKQCFSCKQQFRREELVDYASNQSTQLHSYCPTCLAEKQERDRFSDAVCSIFGLKKPGPRIWTERKRLHEKYGYTDATIIDCLDYLYKEMGTKKFAESLCMITPTNVENMLRYKERKRMEAINVAAAMQTQYTEYVVPIEEKKKEKKLMNPDDYLYD